MVAEAEQRDARAWSELGVEMGRNLAAEIRGAPTGERMRELMAEQVDLITSLPRKAAQRVHRLAIEAMPGGVRPREIAQEILQTGRVTQARAMLIARTETGRAASTLMQARAEHLGSDGYIWRTMHDADVREMHRKLDGKFFRWDDPPVAGERGERSHPGAIYNCRCFAQPVFAD
jgi:SPP1 gp7 family putative phage head morphogenesis protein